MKNLFVILPCYNEQEDICSLLENWENNKDLLRFKDYNLSIICVDDGSEDDTQIIIQGFAEKCDNVTLLVHEKNRGLGEALKTGIMYFNSHSKTCDAALVMDSDNTHDPKYVFEMLDKKENGADCVIASRYEPGASVHGVPAHRLFLSNGAKVFYFLVLGVRGVKDYTCGYRVYSHEIIKKAVDKYGDNLITQNGFACMMELLYKLSIIGANFAEVPFELRYDNKMGKSKMRLLKTIFDSLFVALKLRIDCRNVIRSGAK